MSFAIRRLTAADAAAYRMIRLEALANVPDAFADSIQEAEKRPDSYWTALFEDERVFFGAFVEQQLIGICNFLPGAGLKVRHKGWVLGVYVSPSGRGSGCAGEMIETVLNHARTLGLRQVLLDVARSNLGAQKIYTRAGFTQYGTEPDALCVDGEYVDEHLMVKFLEVDKK